MIIVTVNAAKVACEKKLRDFVSELGTFLEEFAPAKLEIIGYRKICKCGASYNRREFCELPKVGEQGDEVEKLELRNCGCGLTIAWVMQSTDPETIKMIEDQIK